MRKVRMLRQYRIKKGWTLEEASAAFGLSLSYLSELETGKTPMTLTAARKIETATSRKIKAVDLLGLRAGA
jgi:transcriptional regulator with XRE-family HTH domain